MATKTYSGIQVKVNDEGYFLDSSQWTKEVAAEVAKEEGLSLTDKHYEVLEFLRNKVTNGEALSIRGIGKSGIIDIKEFYQLFPGAPLKKATKIAGVAKPESCV